jgi:hypothetical protein
MEEAMWLTIGWTIALVCVCVAWARFARHIRDED